MPILVSRLHSALDEISGQNRTVAKIKIGKGGNLANKMFQYAYCRRLQELVPQSALVGYNIPEFDLVRPDDTPLRDRTLHIEGGHQHSVASIAYKLRERIYDDVLFEGYVQRLEYYPDREQFGSFFRGEAPAEMFGPDVLLINVRGREVLRNMHPDYGPTPVSYFEQIANETKLTPVIMGQIGDDPYSDALKRTFRGCRFLEHRSALGDFQTVRHATNIAISVSTFSWLAAWLSNTAQNIHLPVKGFLHPQQRPDVDLLPTRDERYHFYEFRIEHWHATVEQMDNLICKSQDFRKIASSTVRAMIR
ncbi:MULTISPECIES: hypothetical protein [Bradyrhizobium]|uniref:hypothetical protein n=1 Tax=Bradyrhizobium TaxID=374 RepID=UPI001EDB4049|nr:hypothetical protein [Bradyrhizobium zhengyangense]MCG2643811.1 hypothetical protein [Bradyrhizobium zhengyangense]